MKNKGKMACREVLFEDAETFKDAANIVLCEHAPHNYYHHYTTLDCALKLISSRRLLLSRCNSLFINDLQEPKKFNDDSDVLSRTYIACFGYGRVENAAMWGLYGRKNPFALRIMIPGEKLRQWMEEIEFIKGKFGKSSAALKALDTRKFGNGRAVAITPTSVRFGDMLYVAVENGKESDGGQVGRSHVASWGNAMCHCKDEDLIDVVKMYPGWVKDIEWSYERESRLNVRFAEAVNTRQISIRIPDYVIDSMRFTLSPWLDKSLEGIVENAIVQAIGTPNINASGDLSQPSALRGAPHFK